MIAGRSTRMEVLELLRRKGRASAETISAELRVTPNAIRQHLTNLERDGFVVSTPEKSRRGRPSLLFELTERADSVFPKREARTNFHGHKLQSVDSFNDTSIRGYRRVTGFTLGTSPVAAAKPFIDGDRFFVNVIPAQPC